MLMMEASSKELQASITATKIQKPPARQAKQPKKSLVLKIRNSFEDSLDADAHLVNMIPT
jgi:hypothetical protein